MDQRGGTFPIGKKVASPDTHKVGTQNINPQKKLITTPALFGNYRIIPLTIGIILFIIGGTLAFLSKGFLLTTLGITIMWFGWSCFKVGLFGSKKLVEDMCTTETTKDLPVTSQMEWNYIYDHNHNNSTNITDNLSDSDKLFLKGFAQEGSKSDRQSETNHKIVDSLQQAMDGDSEAICRLGIMYHDGDGVQMNPKQAAGFFKIAAELGNMVAQYNLGLCFLKGTGVKENKKQAAKWIRKAAEQGLAKAQYAMGVIYFEGDGVKSNFKKAEEWYWKSAKQGNLDAKRALAELEKIYIQIINESEKS